MGNTTDNTTDAQAGTLLCKRGVGCRIAYVLDGRQPVLCSYISDQPLFFMDFEDETYSFPEDREEFPGFEAIEDGVAALIGEMDAFAARMDEDSGDALSCFSGALRMMLESGERPAPEDPALFEETLRKSRLATAYLDFAAAHGTVLHYDAQIDGAVYDRNSGLVLINPNLSRPDKILLVARELRRVWQHRNGALINPLTFQPEQAVLVHRAQIADLAVAAVRVAWELQLAGEKEAWQRLEGSSMEDLARAFAREAYLDFRTLNNGDAQGAVFESWFLSDRCRHEDRALIQMMLADYQGYVFDMEQSSRAVTAELLAALGSMPFGKNYLAPHAATIVTDAVFTEVRDRSNANFLWFIKFERSFRETEQELQTGEDITGRGDPSGLSKNKNIRFGDHEQDTQIISLQRDGNDAASTQACAGSGNIIPFRHGRGRE